MDPLSIGSAVVGLIAGASRIAPILYHFITHTRDAPKTASQILDEMNSITAALERLQAYLIGASQASVSRRLMLSLRNIVATLTACVTTYSDLELVVSKCVEAGKVQRMKWMINEGEIVELVQRVQAHKLSLTLMLTILQCESMQEAETSMTRLIDLVESLVASNADLQARIDGDHATARDPTQQVIVTEDLSASTSTLSQSSSAFETDLETSRVYRKLRRRTSIWSLSTSQQGSMALTAFSNLTMDDVSNLSVVRLPVWSPDLSNASDYDFEANNLAPSGSLSRLPRTMNDQPLYAAVPRRRQRRFPPAIIHNGGGQLYDTTKTKTEWVIGEQGDKRPRVVTTKHE